MKSRYITLYYLFLCTAALGVDWLQVGTMVLKEMATERRWLCFATVNGLSVTETSDTERGDQRGSGPVSFHSLCRETRVFLDVDAWRGGRRCKEPRFAE